MQNLTVTVISVLIITGVLSVFAFFLFAFLKKQLQSEIKNSRDEFLQLAQKQFEVEQGKAATELETRKTAIESSLNNLKDQLDQYRQMIHQFEKDRDQKYGNLEAQLKQASQTTVNLQEATSKLTNILGNNKERGQWGERMAEDIIRHCGLIEGVNYSKQTKLETSSNKPDYTFFLPDEHKINMDVKFPLSNYLNMVNAKEAAEKERFGKEFVRDIKNRIREIQDRNYINPKENTLDFVLLFIPNEQVFGLIHESVPGLMDETLKQKVVLCSPFTLYAMLSVVRQSFENFRYEKDMKKIIQLVDQFTKIYSTFKTRFDSVGDSIEKLDKVYQDICEKSFKQLDTKIRHIDEYKTGQGIALENDEELLIEADANESKEQANV